MPEAQKSYGTAEKTDLDGSRVEISGSIPYEIWGKYRAQAVKNLNDSMSIDGFRKGQVPENILISKIGEMAILEEMAELALAKAFVGIIIDKKIDAIGKPEIRVTKLANDNPLEFKAVTAIVPQVSLPDYKKIASKEVKKQNIDDVKVTDKDVDDTILRIRKTRASTKEAPAEAGGHSHGHDMMTPEEHRAAHEADLPELTDDFVKSLGDFNDVQDFKDKVKVMVGEHKQSEAKEKTRLRVADAIVEASKVDLPEVMVESELERTEAQFKADIENMGFKMDDYLKHAKKSIDDIRKEWRPYAEKKAKLQLVLNEIAKKEAIKASPEEVKAESDHILEHFKDADRERAEAYAETVITNEKVFQFLEKA